MVRQEQRLGIVGLETKQKLVNMCNERKKLQSKTSSNEVHLIDVKEKSNREKERKKEVGEAR